jgi:hypothetical protein
VGFTCDVDSKCCSDEVAALKCCLGAGGKKFCQYSGTCECLANVGWGELQLHILADVVFARVLYFLLGELAADKP